MCDQVLIDAFARQTLNEPQTITMLSNYSIDDIIKNMAAMKLDNELVVSIIEKVQIDCELLLVKENGNLNLLKKFNTHSILESLNRTANPDDKWWVNDVLMYFPGNEELRLTLIIRFRLWYVRRPSMVTLESVVYTYVSNNNISNVGLSELLRWIIRSYPRLGEHIVAHGGTILDTKVILGYNPRLTFNSAIAAAAHLESVDSSVGFNGKPNIDDFYLVSSALCLNTQLGCYEWKKGTPPVLD